MEKCAYCGRKSVIIVTLPLCRNHFVHYFEKKVKRTIKKYGLINPKKKVIVIDSGNASSAVAVYLMKKFYPKVIVVNKNINKKNRNKIIKKNNQVVISQNLDEEAEEIMTSMAKNSKRELTRLGPKNKSMIKPLYLCTQKEIMVYAKSKKLSFKNNKAKKSGIMKFLDKFDRRYTWIKHSIVSSYLDFMPLIKKRLLKPKK